MYFLKNLIIEPTFFFQKPFLKASCPSLAGKTRLSGTHHSRGGECFNYSPGNTFLLYIHNTVLFFQLLPLDRKEG